MLEFASPAFWVAVLQIIAIDIILSGDNAVVIALACRNLPAAQRRTGVLWGVFGAVSLRVLLTAFAAQLLGVAYLKLVGGVLLLWIGVKLLLPDASDGRHEIDGSSHLWGAVRTVIVADFVMSLDNVIAVAAASRGSLLLLVFGLLVSIPLIIWSSQLVMRLMERYPVIVVLGAGLLGWVAGGMMVSDAAVRAHTEGFGRVGATAAGIAGALLVVGVGRWLASRRGRDKDYEVV